MSLNVGRSLAIDVELSIMCGFKGLVSSFYALVDSNGDAVVACVTIDSDRSKLPPPPTPSLISVMFMGGFSSGSIDSSLFSYFVGSSLIVCKGVECGISFSSCSLEPVKLPSLPNLLTRPADAGLIPSILAPAASVSLALFLLGLALCYMLVCPATGSSNFVFVVFSS